MVEILERGKMLELPNERKGDFVADYEYTAKSINGRRTRGKIQAQDFEQAWTKIRAMGLYPVKVKEERGKVRRRPLGYGLLSRFMGEMTVMLNSAGAELNQCQGIEKRFKGDLWKTLSYDPARRGFFSGDGDAGWCISTYSHRHGARRGSGRRPRRGVRENGRVLRTGR